MTMFSINCTKRQRNVRISIFLSHDLVYTLEFNSSTGISLLFSCQHSLDQVCHRLSGSVRGNVETTKIALHYNMVVRNCLIADTTMIDSHYYLVRLLCFISTVEINSRVCDGISHEGQCYKYSLLKVIFILF